jgi:hypothetical protein
MNYSRQCTFKRDQTLECYHADEMELYEEEIDSSMTA